MKEIIIKSLEHDVIRSLTAEERQKALLSLHDDYGLKYSEIAIMLNRSEALISRWVNLKENNDDKFIGIRRILNCLRKKEPKKEEIKQYYEAKKEIERLISEAEGVVLVK